ncbi:MAG TPA: sterol desaturase family protein [Polyangiaceae bacterium]|nr:sterol desaturase family protein [Polyangiaceae bacterium]
MRYTQECWDTAQAFRADAHRRAEPHTKPRASIRIFVSPWVERVLGRAHPITPALWFGPFIGLAAYRAFTVPTVRPAAALLFAAGWLFWTLLEYVLHRFLFHMAAHTPEERLRAFLMHGYHHEFPSDGMRLVAPPLMSWPLGLAVGVLMYLIVGPVFWIFSFAGAAAGYIAYDWIHYYTHHAHPRTALGRRLKRYHLAHHFSDDGSHFGVSSPLWDVIFRTYRARPRARLRASSPIPPQRDLNDNNFVRGESLRSTGISRPRRRS